VRAIPAARTHARLAAAVALALAAASALTLGSPHAARGQSPAGHPNIVVVMTDDQTVAELRGMSKTRRLIAAQGVRFRRSYVSYPVCCPSRATYLTGQYAHNHHA
jgi:N-acetylglucosamine-6-sulfatase